MSLLSALRDRADELQISRATIDDIAGLPHAYASKVFSLSQIRRLGFLSLGPVLEALGYKLLFVVDPVSMRRHARKREKRVECCVRHRSRHDQPPVAA